MFCTCFITSPHIQTYLLWSLLVETDICSLYIWGKQVNISSRLERSSSRKFFYRSATICTCWWANNMALWLAIVFQTLPCSMYIWKTIPDRTQISHVKSKWTLILSNSSFAHLSSPKARSGVGLVICTASWGVQHCATSVPSWTFDDESSGTAHRRLMRISRYDWRGSFLICSRVQVNCKYVQICLSSSAEVM